MPAQPSNDWYIQLLNEDGSTSGAKISAASLGIEDIQFDKNDQAADVWTFTVGGKNFDAAALWPYGQLLCILDASNVRVAFGRVEPWSRAGSPDAQNHFGRIVNPWWYLANKVYEQTFKFTSGNYPVAGSTTPPTYTTYTTPRVVLNVLFDAVTGFYPATTGQQIADAVNWAISLGAPIALGDVEPSTQPFTDPQRGIFCADVIKLMFRKEPDFVMDWDYSTTPFPTLHFRKAASLTPVTINLATNVQTENITVKERPDWQRSYVRINYDTTNSVNGSSFLVPTVDQYPAVLPAGVEAKFRGVDLFADLQGSSVNSTTTDQEATFSSVAFDINSVAQWQKWMPELDPLKHKDITAVAIYTDTTHAAPGIATLDENNAGGAEDYDPACIYEMTKGQWAAWIPDSNAQTVRVFGFAKVTKKKGDAKPTTEIVPLVKEFTAVSINTNGLEKTFSQSTVTTTVTQYAEQPPVGLAEAMWRSWQNLAIEGTITNVEAVIGYNQNITRSHCLNIATENAGASGRPDWRNARALIRRISGSFLNGSTIIEFGAPLRITGHDLIDAVRATRFRTTTLDLSYFFGGAGNAGGHYIIEPTPKAHVRHARSGSVHKQSDVISENPQPKAGTDAFVQTDGKTGISMWNAPTQAVPGVKIDPSLAAGSDGQWHQLVIREEKVYTLVNGVCKQRSKLILCSDTFRGNGDPE